MTSDLVVLRPLPPSSHAKSDDHFPAAAELEQELKKRIEGEVRFDPGSRALYATDGSNYRQIPIGLVVPKTAEDILATVDACRKFNAPLLSRGGGTSLAGQCCNVAVVMDHSKYYNQILELDPHKNFARVHPGVVLDTLRDAAEKYHLTFAPDPSTHNHCTLGGMLGNNSCGVHSVMGGKTVENTEELDIVLYDGTRMTVGATSEAELDRIIRAGGRRGDIYRRIRDLRDKYADLIREKYPKIPRRVSGYNLDQLLPENGFNVARALVGSEGTLVTILQAKLRLVYSPPYRTLVVLGYNDIFEAGDHVPQILEFGPVGLEGIDQKLIDDIRHKGKHAQDLRLFPEGHGYLLVEFGGASQKEADANAEKMMTALKAKPGAPSMKWYDTAEEENEVWKVRESGLGATAFVPGQPVAWEGWEDAAVPPDKVGAYLRDFRKLLDDFHYEGALYGHFGQGCIHTRINFDLEDANGIRHYRDFIDHAADLVVRYGGSLSGEHGDGQSRAALLPKMFGERLVHAFEEFKQIWDPTNRMNPHKIVFPYQPDENLRLGADYRPENPPTHFQFHKEGSFARATLHCVGVGECRRHNKGTMCPSYMVTREEMHSTRGRAHLLWEMLQGEVITDGWKSEAVKEALDLCLSCKGCTGQCPVEVDIPTYKAEFMSHYYEGKMRPLKAYAFGFIDRWAQLAMTAPGFVNLINHAPITSQFAKAITGMPQKRRIPSFAPYSFTQWCRENRINERTGGHMDVLLWPDTFNNYFHPQTAQAAVEVLEHAGFNVRVPDTEHVCCGRPLYDFGFLDKAKDYIHRNFRVIRDHIDYGTPMVVLEPSCASVFRDELINLLPNDELAKRLHKQTFLLSEFLDKHAGGYQPPKLKRKMLVHGHCHHKALLKMDSETNILKKMEVDIDMPDTGCCGMAGPFGFEREKYDVSIAAGERVLLPAVREAKKDTIICVDGFSCREQIEQQTSRRGLHLAEVLKLAIDHGAGGPKRGKPEDTALREIRNQRRASIAQAAAVVAGIGAAAALFIFAATRVSKNHDLTNTRG